MLCTCPALTCAVDTDVCEREQRDSSGDRKAGYLDYMTAGETLHPVGCSRIDVVAQAQLAVLVRSHGPHLARVGQEDIVITTRCHWGGCVRGRV